MDLANAGHQVTETLRIDHPTLAVLRASEQPLPDYIAARYVLHAAILDALGQYDHDRALSLITQHNTSNPRPAALASDGSAAAAL